MYCKLLKLSELKMSFPVQTVQFNASVLNEILHFFSQHRPKEVF